MVEQYAVYWKQLGAELGVKDYQVANITENNASRKLRQVEECCSQMLQKWLEIDPSATWGRLDNVLQKITSLELTAKGGNHGYKWPLVKCVGACKNGISAQITCV